jgi:hypothetical protein
MDKNEKTLIFILLVIIILQLVNFNDMIIIKKEYLTKTLFSKQYKKI